MASQWSDNGNYWIVWVGRTGTIEPASIYSRSWTVPCGLARYAYRGETATDHRPCPPFTNTRAFGLLSDLTDLLANRPCQCIPMPFTSVLSPLCSLSILCLFEFEYPPTANKFLHTLWFTCGEQVNIGSVSCRSLLSGICDRAGRWIYIFLEDLKREIVEVF